MDVEKEKTKEQGGEKGRCAHGKMMIIIRRGPVQNGLEFSLVLWDSARETRLFLSLFRPLKYFRLFFSVLRTGKIGMDDDSLRRVSLKKKKEKLKDDESRLKKISRKIA